jgi:hypothetical protein
MPKMHVVFEKPDASDEDYVRVGIGAGPTPDQPYGYWGHMAARSSGGLMMHAQDDAPKPIRKTWDEALTYAHSHGLSLIYVEDPEGCFPADELQV